ncbi:MAG: hypothetical protein ACPGLY_27065 [Rubripirellula sp.]
MQLLGKKALAAPAVINQKSVRVLEKIKSGKIDVEMNAVGVMLIITLGVVYATASYVGMKTFKGCGAVNEQERYKTLHRLLSHTLAISLTIPATLLIGKMFKNDVSAFMAVFGLLGILGASVSVDITRKCDNATEQEKKASIGALLCFILSFLVGVALVRRK